MHDQRIYGYGLCECGCGQQTAISNQNHAPFGWVKGEPKRFVRGHSTRRKAPDYLPEDHGYSTPCWIWQGADSGKGYGRLSRDGKTLTAHRYVYEQFKGQIPDGLELDHLCRVTRCVNPDHLEPVTHAENMHRGAVAQKTHCKYGHEMTPENTYMRPRGGRDCRICIRARTRAYAQRKAQVA